MMKGFVVLAVTIVLVILGLAIGSAAQNSAITKQCDKLEKVVINDVVYSCKKQ